MSTYEKIITDDKIFAKIAYIDSKEIKNIPAFDNIPYHWHRSIELSYVNKGSFKLWINNQCQIIKEGEFLLINSSTIHKMMANDDQDVEVIMAIISYDHLKKIYPDIDNIMFRMDNNAFYINRFKEIYQTFAAYAKKPNELDYLMINSYLYEIIYLLCKYCQYPKDHIQITAMDTMQTTILNYIDDNYQKDLSLKNMAENFSLSEEYFSRLFHKSFGITFKDYLNKYRVYMTFDDVIKTNKTISHIAIDNGFKNVKSFIEHFKKIYGHTPYQYRQMSKKHY